MTSKTTWRELSKDDLRYEIARGEHSRFANIIPHLEGRLAQLEDEERANVQSEQLAIATKANLLSEKANEISIGANRMSKWAIWLSILALLVSLGVLGLDFLVQKSDTQPNTLPAQEPEDTLPSLTVESVTPADGATNVALTSRVTIRFTIPVFPETVNANSLTLSDDKAEIDGVISLPGDAKSANFIPTDPLAHNTTYTINISSAIQGMDGQTITGNNADGSFSSSFETIREKPPAVK